MKVPRIVKNPIVVTASSNRVPGASPLRVAVVGGGIGGLTTAALLASAGCRVVLFEKNAETGGKLGWEEAGGYAWDTGPSLLTMPAVLEEVWQACGARMQDDLELVRLPVTCRYRWRDGTVIDEDEDFWQRPELANFLRYAEGLYDLSAEAFLRNRLEDWWRLLLRPGELPNLRHLPKIASFKTLAEKVDVLVPEEHLRQILYRFATYNGSSPYQAPAAFNIIAYVQRHFGGWYVRGGLVEVPRAVTALALRAGAEIRCRSEVSAVHREQGGYLVELDEAGADAESFDVVVSNQDVLTASGGWFGGLLHRAGKASKHPRAAADISLSGFVLLLGMRCAFPELEHHTILFSDEYRREFEQLFGRREPAQDPTIYISITSREDPSHAPPGGENWFVLVNVPAVDPDSGSADQYWGANADAYGDHIIAKISAHLGRDIAGDIAVRQTITPGDFGRRHLSYGGSLYGYASHGVTSSFRRPAMEHPSFPGLYFVGGTTHPGGGIPLAMLGAQIASRRIFQRYHVQD